MSGGFSRSVLRWLQTIDLSQPYTNPRVDFASGYLIAEIVTHYIPSESMHSFSNFLSVKMRTDNWNQLLKIFIAHKIPISQALIDDVIKRKNGSAVKLIEILYKAFTKRTPCHHEIGKIETKPTTPKNNVTILTPPDIPKKQEEPKVESPTIPNRKKFISTSFSQQTDSSDEPPLNFESATIVTSGPNFLQLRNTSSLPSQSSEKDLDDAIDNLNHEMTPENLKSFVKCIENPQQLIYFFTNYPSDIVINYIKESMPYISPSLLSAIISAVSDYLLPNIDFEKTSTNDLIDFIFYLSPDDSFTHLFLLSKFLEVIDPSTISSALWYFVQNEQNFTKPLSDFLLQKVEENVNNDKTFVLPLVLYHMLEYDHETTSQLISHFPPTGDKSKDIILSLLYTHSPNESSEYIRNIIVNDKEGNISAFILNELLHNSDFPKSEFVNFLMCVSNPSFLITNQFIIHINDHEEIISPLINQLNPLEIVSLICDNVIKTQPDSIDKEIVVMSVLMEKINVENEDVNKWNDIFQKVHEYLYLAFCDKNVCKQSSKVCLIFYKLLKNKVFQTFSNLFKALNFVFPANSPKICKTNALDFLKTAANISPMFSQTVLKLIMNFPAKMNTDLDKLVVTLKKVRK